jgi:imidazolonepropionase-like amidohydrolase
MRLIRVLLAHAAQTKRVDRRGWLGQLCNVFAIRANHAIDGEGFRAGGATVLVEDGRIVGVESAAYELHSDCELLDYGNATVLPGLIDNEIVAAVRERAERQVDVVKVMAGGGMVTGGTDVFVPQFSIEEPRLLVDQARTPLVCR